MTARLLPKGRLDLLRQIVLFCGAYWLYRLVRGQADGRAAAAFENAREIIELEQGLGMFFEPARTCAFSPIATTPYVCAVEPDVVVRSTEPLPSRSHS